MPDDIRSRIMDAAKEYDGTPYGLPPGPGEIDCSLLIIKSFEDAGVPFPPGIRTAQQIRQACVLVPWDGVALSDCLFFERTYEITERPGSDGHTASHIGLSFGAGTQRMRDANSVHGTGITNISTPYWQDHLFQAGRAKHVEWLAAPGPLPPTPGSPAGDATLDNLHRIRWEGMGVGYNPITGIAAFWKEHPELGAAVSVEIILEDGRAAQAFAGGIVVAGPNGPRIL